MLGLFFSCLRSRTRSTAPRDKSFEENIFVLFNFNP